MAEFDVGTAYTRADIYELLHVLEDKRHGAWNRGHREWDGEMFIFATVGVGTTSGFRLYGKDGCSRGAAHRDCTEVALQTRSQAALLERSC